MRSEQVCASSLETMLKAKAGRTLVVKGEQCYRREVIMGRTLEAGPSVGHPFFCEATNLCAVPVANSSRSGRKFRRVALHCPQYKGSINCPGRVSLNTVSACMEEFVGYL